MEKQVLSEKYYRDIIDSINKHVQKLCEEVMRSGLSDSTLYKESLAPLLDILQTHYSEYNKKSYDIAMKILTGQIEE